MEASTARATLATESLAGPSVTTVVSRAAVEEALRAGDTPELVLTLARSAPGGPSEDQEVALEWDRSDLETLLRTVPSDDIQLTFDANALYQASDVDVEAHGLREKMAVLAVATAAAGAFAGPAAAYIPTGDTAGSAPHAVVDGAGPASHAVVDSAGPASHAVVDSAGPASHVVVDSAGPASHMAIEGGGSAPAQPAAVTESDDTSTAVGIGAGIALAITGAAFAMRRRRGTSSA